MKISEVCIKRPVFATVINIIIVLIGLVAWQRLVVREIPKIDTPTLTIETGYPGASPKIIENTVTKPLEDELSRIEGIDTITSESGGGKSTIIMRFKLEANLDAAALDATYTMTRVRSRMPNDVQQSVLRKADKDAMPIVYLSLASNTRTATELADFAERELQNEFETLYGVSRVEVVGGGHFKLNVWLDPNKLSGHKLTNADVYNAISRANLERPGGQIRSGNREFNVTTKALLDKPEKFDEIIVGERDGKFIRLSDVGRASFDPVNTSSRFMANGKTGVGIAIYRSVEVSPVDVAHSVKEKVAQLKGERKGFTKRITNDMEFKTAIDYTTFIERAIDEVYETIGIAVVLVILVVFAFVGSLRAALIPLVTIPISLIATFTFLYAMGFSINLLTLLAIVLAVGLVVDDAIVVLENVYRYIEKGDSPYEAAIKGSREIGFAIVAMTLTLAAVYAPLALAKGITGALFTEFALTLAGAVLISGVTALTLSPMMCSKIMKKGMSLEGHADEKTQQSLFHQYIMRWVFGGIAYVENKYNKVIGTAMRFRYLVILIGAAFTAASLYVLFDRVPQEFAPAEDRGLLTGRSQSTDGATVETLENTLGQISAIIDNTNDVDGSLLVLTGMRLTKIATLKPWEVRSKTDKEIAEKLNENLREVTALEAKVSPSASPIGGGGSSDASMEFIMRSPREMEDLTNKAMELRDSILAHKELAGKIKLNVFVPVTLQEYTIRLRRDIASTLGLSAQDLALNFEIFTGGKKAGNFAPKNTTKLYDIMVGVPEEYRRSPDDLRNLYTRITKRRGEEVLVPLSQLVEVVPVETTTNISHYNKMRNVTFKTELKGVSMGKAISVIQEVSEKKLADTSDYVVEFTGEAKSFLTESQNILFVFIFAVLFIYLVLAAQFESFIDPLIILLSVPLSIAGAAVTLYFVGGSLNIYSQIGMVTLIGLITKHGILIVDFANAAVEKGASKLAAVTEACKLRLRPILMTTGAMVFGAVPLAIATGAGAEVRFQLGWVIVGGMTIGTLFTLFVVPAFYTLLSRKQTAQLPA